MRQITTGILSRQRVVRQGLALSALRSMFEEGITGGALARCMVEEDAAAKVEVAVPKVDVPDPSGAQNQDAVQNQDTTQNQVSIKNPEVAHYYGEPTSFGTRQDTVCPPCHPEDQGQNRSSIPMSKVYTLREDIRSTNDFYNHLARIEQEKQNKKAALDHAKTQISDFIYHLNQISENLSHTFFDPCKPLSYDQATEKKEDLVKALQRLEREFVEKRELEIDYVVDQYRQHSFLPGLNNDACTIKDCSKLFKALNQKCEVDAIKVAIYKYDATIQKLEQDYQDRCKKTTTAELEQTVIPELGASQKAVARSIAQEKINLSQAKKTMVDINNQQEIFDNRSVISKIAGFITRDHTKTHLQKATTDANDKIIGLQKKLESLEHKNSMYLSQLACAQKVAELQKQEAKRAAEQEAQLAKEKAEQEALRAQEQKSVLQHNDQEIIKYRIVVEGQVVECFRDKEFLQKQYQALSTDFCKNTDNALLQQRYDALQKTVEQNFMQYEQRYALSVQAMGYLQSQGLHPADYAVCLGTALQQQLHAEVCQIFEQLAQQQNNRFFACDAMNFADAAHDQNKIEQIPVATTLSDIAWTLAGIPLGIAESAKDALLLPVHLPEIIKGLGKAIYFVAETMMFNDAEAFGSSLALQHADERNELIKQGVIQAAATVVNAVEHASWHDRCKGATRLIADFYVPGKIYSAVGHLFAGVVAQSKNVRNLENAASMMDHEFGFEQIVEEVLQTTKSLEPTTPEGLKGQILAEFMEAETTVFKATKAIVKFDKKLFKHCLNKFPENKNSLHHLFRNKEGHIVGTLENKKMILDLVQNVENCAGEIEGVVWYSKLEKNGEQLWACVWMETQEIRNCGINKEPRIWNSISGYNINRLKSS